MAKENGQENSKTAYEEKVELAKPSTNESQEAGKDADGGDQKQKRKDPPPPTIKPWQLFKFADKWDILLMIVGTFGAICLGASMPLIALLFGQLMDSFGKNTGNPDELASAVTTVALRFLWVAMGVAAAGFAEMTCWMITGERQSARIRSRYLSAVLRQDIAFFDMGVNTGEVTSHMSGDIVLVQEAMGEKVGTFVRFTATFLGGFVIAFINGWLLTLVMLAALPLLAICGATIAMVVSKASTMGQEAYNVAGAIVEQAIGAIRTVAAFTGEGRAVRQYSKLLDKAFWQGVKESAATGAGVGATMFVMFSSYALALWYGSVLIVQPGSGYSGGKVFSVLFGVIIGGMSLGQAAPNIQAFATGLAAAHKIFEVIDRKPPIDVSSDEGLSPDSITGNIEFDNVDFAYPSRPDAQILRSFSLTIPAGKTAALVGESGSGKSTVVSLLERFYSPLSGRILLDGTDIAALRLSWLRSQVGLVSQEPALFATSIEENIRFGRDTEASMEEIEAAARMANIHDFIASLPDGYSTLVGERGTQLSGGQKQRVAIARAILRNPTVLLLDEATSALDSESEKVVQAALDSIMQDRTTVVIAHRLTTIRNADMIAAVQRGKIVQTGTHSELMALPDGAYAQLVKLQASQETRKRGSRSLNAAAAAAVAGSVPDDLTAGEHGVGELVDTQGSTSVVAGGEGDAGMELAVEGVLAQAVAVAAGPLAAAAIGTDAVAQEVVVPKGDEKAGSKNPLSALIRRLKGGQKKAREGEEGEEGNGGLDEEAGLKGNKKGKEEKEKDVSFFQLAALNLPEWPWALSGSLAAIAHGLLFPAFSIVLSRIIVVFYDPNPDQLRSKANFWASMFVVVGGGAFISLVLQMTLFGYVGQQLTRRVRRLCFATVLRQEIAWFDKEENSSGAIGARLSTDAAYVKSMVGNQVALIVQNLATIVAGLVLAFTANWQLSLVVLCLMPMLGLAGSMQMKALQGFSESAKTQFEDASKVANDAIGSIRTVAAFGAERRVEHLYDDKCQGPIAQGVRKGYVAGAGQGFSQFFLFATYALAFWYGGQLVQQGKTTFGSVFQVFFALVMSAMGVAQSATLAPDFTVVQTAVNSIFRLLNRQSAIDPCADGEVPADVKGDIAFEHVSFAYPTRPNTTVLADFTLTIRSGQMIALVGESGSGKSTVVSLLERFYNPLSGRILLDGTDIAALRLVWLRSQLGLVSQEPSLFNLSIRDNIAYGRGNVSLSADDLDAVRGRFFEGAAKSIGVDKGEPTEAEIIEAAKAANAHSFVSGLPDGYNTLVGERGVQLSGGQKQRVAIARAVLRDPRILLLDEATSALDAESEAVVQAALENVMVGRTTIVIAHRLSTIQAADCIVVMQKGRVVEQGKHEELIAKGGAYASLVAIR